MNIRYFLPFPKLAAALILLIVTASPVFSQMAATPGNSSERGGASSDSTGAPDVDFIPFRGVVVATKRGSTGESSIEIVNRASESLEITGIENSSERFTARVESIQPGQRYRLTVTFEGKGPDGKVAEWLYLTTASGTIRIPVHTEVIPTVYTFPKAVEMGKFSLSHIRGNPESARSVAQILMVYRKNTTGFEIEVTSDLPFLKIESEQGSEGDRWENTIWLDPEQVQPGEFEGTIFIETNDSEVPKLEVPVSGLLLDQ